MIKANEARQNVTNYDNAINAEIEAKVNELIEVMDRSIQFHSKNGFEWIDFCPYEKSRFTNVHALEYAQELFTKIFEENGYKVIENHYGKNTLKIGW